MTIQSTVRRPPPPAVNISWSPVGPVVTFTIAGTTYPYEATYSPSGQLINPATPPSYRTPTNSDLTFTAEVTLPEGVFIKEYAWDFGDGYKAYGTPVSHRYVAASPETRVTLCVTDNYNRRICVGKNLNLYAASAVVMQSGGAS